MPRLSAWLIRTALLYLGFGFSLGALILFQKGVPYSAAVWLLLPMHVEFVLIGWTAQLAMGVGFWILPRWGTARGNEALAWLAFVLLNVGVLCVSVGGWPAAPAAVPLLGRGFEALSALAFAAHAWPRIKPLGG